MSGVRWDVITVVFVPLAFAACGGSHAGGADAGSGGGPDSAASPDGAAGAVRIIRGDPNQTMWFSLTIEGHGLTGVEGKLAIARIGTPQRPPERLGSGQARIQNGAFQIAFPQGCEASLYKQKVLFIDLDADGSCTPGVDRVYRDYRFLDQDMTITLSDSVPAPAPDAQMSLSTNPPTDSDCQALNEPWPDS